MNSSDDNSIIQLSSITKKFGDLTAVNDISLEIRKGEIFALLGPNGAGKTTAISMICGLLPPDSGEIIFQGTDNAAEDFRRHIGICPQENVFWPKLTCYEQLYFAGRMYDLPGKTLKKRAKELLSLLGLEDKVRVLAHKLSGGMKRRLNICLALIHDPQILILDEPEAGLDPQSRILVRGVIRSLAQKKTVILTTHNMDEAERLSDRAAIIDRGRLLLTDTPKNLKKTVGEGDTLEIELAEKNQQKLERLSADLAGRFDSVKILDTVMLINGMNLIESIGYITEKIKNSGLTVSSMAMRENTLEDVFIHLTGRRLRQ